MARKEIRWVVLLVLVGAAVVGLWYLNERPAQMQAAISEVRDGANVNHVMTVEAISEGGASVVGRAISIVNARITEVTGPRTLWVAGSEGEPLLVVIAPSRHAVTFASGDRIGLEGVVREGPSNFSLTAEDHAQVAKADLYVLATDLRSAR
jgi:hypothetical protein